MGSFDCDRSRYLESLADELLVQSTRVRNLIGGRHWLSDGHHKEYLLGSVLHRHVPEAVLVGRGFVISPTDPEHCSTEQDLLVLDVTREAPIFHQSGLMIAFPNQVLAAISVKTNLGRREVTDSIEGLNSVISLVNLSTTDSSSCWCAVFCFEVPKEVTRNPKLPYDYLLKGIKSHPARSNPLAVLPQPVGPNLVCSSRDFV